MLVSLQPEKVFFDHPEMAIINLTVVLSGCMSVPWGRPPPPLDSCGQCRSRGQVRAIRKLRVLGSGFDLLIIGGRQYVRSVPGELNLDKNKALEVAQVSRALCGNPSRPAVG